ncbi:hypothetical protein [Micromonospora echinofusca]|uniref:Uncharacterized protein n=1 Tax=Micromonospora echinofusca TaxID=47858 RepID=A0ABS3VTL6_MICEH|nr:hypothetical protein [Micromonospora echinofusca]MBO4207876.1 hypothetical protein [Micromonospora echinofusca]
MPASPVKDKNYDLVHEVQMVLENAWRVDNYIKDAEKSGDNELADWFRRIQQNNMKAGEQGKRMLAMRLQSENG